MFSGKMNVSDLSEGRVDDVRYVIAITDEDELGLSESSLYLKVQLVRCGSVSMTRITSSKNF